MQARNALVPTDERLKMQFRKISLFLFTLALLAGCAPAALVPQPLPTAVVAAVAQPSATANADQPTPTKAEPSATAPAPSPTAPAEAQPEGVLMPVAGVYRFAEGPAVDEQGNVYFSDIDAGRIYTWSPDGTVAVFLDGLLKPNGLAFDSRGGQVTSGMLVVCEGGAGHLIAIDPQHQITVLADQYNGTRFNEPNDLWIDPQGGIYFTDPAYQSPVVQDGEHVYYLTPGGGQVIRVISDLVRPNGVIGAPDGKTLYVADHGAGQTYAYDIGADGTLSNRRLAVASGSDGLEMDAQGNLYLATPNQIRVYDRAGNLLREIPTPENPTNMAFAGADRRTLFITARTAVYTLRLPAAAPAAPGAAAPEAPSQSFSLSSPDIAEDGRLPAEYTCDGAANTLALEWSGAPAGTVSYAVVMHHTASPEDIHWYWVLYNIPADVTRLAKNSAGGQGASGAGTLGNNSVNGRTEYAPPCSKGPGDKAYTYTVYALSGWPQLSVPASEVSRAVLLEAIQSITLASAELNVTYARK
jgi:gluconolactonase